MIDLRSDTVTLPSPAMREAMARAEVGDDVYGEDPSLNSLEERGAALLGKEAGLFVPSGTMANLLAVLVHCKRGDEVVMGDRSHMFLNEAGGPSVLGGTTARTVPTGERGELAPEDLAAAVRADNIHFPGTGLFCLENTHNFAGGQVLDAAYMRRVRAVAGELPVHLDGARLFNAAVALGVPAADLAADADSAAVCFSKGLGAPVGSLLVGTRRFVAEARRWRKKLGGGMRQAGVLAAACHFALDHHVERLAEDHVNARVLAEGLGRIPGVVPLDCPTNILMLDVSGLGKPGAEVLKLLERQDVRLSAIGPATLRAVTHLGISRTDVEAVVERATRALR